MTFKDAILEHMTHDQWMHAARPKIDGSRNLHQHLPSDMSFFILLSSAVGVGGGTSQANYAAGNAYEDALARHRVRRGLPATSIDLCVIRDAGYVQSQVDSANTAVMHHTDKLGVRSVGVDAVLRLIEAALLRTSRSNPSRPSLLDADADADADSQVIMGITDINRLAQHLSMPRERRFGMLQLAKARAAGGGINPKNNKKKQNVASGGRDANTTASLVRRLADASVTTTLSDAAALLVDAVSAKLADMFRLPLEQIDTGLPLSRYGVDSLVAVELRNWLGSSVKAKVTVFEILQSVSLIEFGQLLASKSEYVAARKTA